MDSYIDTLIHLLDTPSDTPVDPAVVDTLTNRWPAFMLPTIMRLRRPHHDMSDDEVSSAIFRIALSLPDPTRLRVLLDPEGTGRYDNFYPAPPANVTPPTSDAIDTFLSTYGNIDPAEEELLNRMIFNPVPDYAATLERDTPTPAPPRDQQDRLLDAFISANTTHATPDSTNDTPPSPDNEPAPTPAANKTPQGSLLSESLAKIFIKQHNYTGAYEIISSLNLKYPEKNIYFADQLRFLKKLIINQEAIERKNKANVNKK